MRVGRVIDMLLQLGQPSETRPEGTAAFTFGYETSRLVKVESKCNRLSH